MSVSSSSWGLGRATVCDCGTPWTFLLPFFLWQTVPYQTSRVSHTLMANSNSVLSPYEILPIDQENKYLRKLSYFIMKLYVVCTH